MSLMNTVMPEGFGFAVVDKRGEVQFHSDSQKNLWENLFEECGYNKHLIAAVAGCGNGARSAR